MTINERIFGIIAEKKLKQADLAKYLNVNQSVVTTWKKRGTVPPLDLAIRICEFLDVSIYELLGVPEALEGTYDDFHKRLIAAYESASADKQECVCDILRIDREEPVKELPQSLTSKTG